MDGKPGGSGQWLGLRAAAQRLGVHPATLRRWADAGQIAVMLTPGGHRRFAAAEVERFAAQRQRPRDHGAGERLEQQALARTRQELTTHQDAQWIRAIGESEREHQRALGRRLMALIFEYVREPRDTLVEEARAIGRAYAESNSRMGLSLTQALEAFLVFRDAITEATLEMPESTAHGDTGVRWLQRINAVLNAMQIAMVANYGA